MRRGWRKLQRGGLTAAEVARKLGISTQRVYQLEASAFRKFRKGLLARGYDAEVLDLPAWELRLILGTVLSD